MGSHIFGFFWVKQFFIFTVSKRTRMYECLYCSVLHSILKMGQFIKLEFKVTKMGSLTGHRIDYNGVGALRGQWHIPSKN